MPDLAVIRALSAGALLSLLLPACLTPPPPGAAAPEAPPAPVSPSPAANAAVGAEDGNIWDGDEHGAAAKGWQDCDKKPGCQATLGPAPGVGFNNSVGLKFHGEGPGWIGGGWNWFGWWPQNAGTDISGFQLLSFHIRIDAKSADEAPDPGSLGVSIKCSSNPAKGQSRDASLVKYTKENLIDGQWHELRIPLGDMKKAEFDPKTAWEFVLSTWSPVPRNFNIYLDDIRFEK